MIVWKFEVGQVVRIVKSCEPRFYGLVAEILERDVYKGAQFFELSIQAPLSRFPLTRDGVTSLERYAPGPHGGIQCREDALVPIDDRGLSVGDVERAIGYRAPPRVRKPEEVTS